MISIKECAIKLNVSPTIIVLFQFKKKIVKKLKKKSYIINGEFYQKNTQRKDVKLALFLTYSITFNVPSVNII